MLWVERNKENERNVFRRRRLFLPILFLTFKIIEYETDYFILALVAAFAFESKAQKFALIDMEYILKNIPSYEMANEQLKQVSQRWEKEITTQAQKVESMYKEYQSNSVFLSDDQKKRKKKKLLLKTKKLKIFVVNISGRKGSCLRREKVL